ncbi:hypothetical protein EVAR_45039_1 [Eumeta japonica]|uniref:Uncharacterized protein n=1 Tax=Eumeta variegata TaxID=151549 RepID=A0A4C1YQR2_EUMVA|nr:hypothetical protein EVAR_45039_1 [Eumeta japonica]
MFAVLIPVPDLLAISVPELADLNLPLNIAVIDNPACGGLTISLRTPTLVRNPDTFCVRFTQLLSKKRPRLHLGSEYFNLRHEGNDDVCAAKRIDDRPAPRSGDLLRARVVSRSQWATFTVQHPRAARSEKWAIPAVYDPL